MAALESAPLPSPPTDDLVLDERPAERPAEPYRVQPLDVLCVVPFFARVIYIWATIPLGPALLGPHPVLLEVLRGTWSAMLAAGAKARIGEVPLWAALVAPLFITMVADPFVYWSGRRFGRPVLDYYCREDERMRRWIGRGERFFQRFGVVALLVAYFNPIPNDIFYFAAGETRMPFWRFLLFDFLGTLLFVGTIVGIGLALGSTGATVADTISHYAWEFTIVLVLGMIVLAAWRQHRKH